MIDYTPLDEPSILRYIFYPRKDVTVCPKDAFDVSVTVDDRVSISCRLYFGHREWPWILYFHGNGEVVSDYDDISPFYHQKGLNLVVADYRGYGASNGIPTLRNLVRDCHILFREVREEVSKRDFRKDLWVMGRSLGSISALEIAHRHPKEVRGLIIESGFPSVVRIMAHLAIPAHGIDLERIDQECVKMIEKISVPSLIIHGDRDTLVPMREAQDLYHHLGTKQKQLLIIPSATHNDIMLSGFKEYFETLRQFVESTARRSPNQNDMNHER